MRNQAEILCAARTGGVPAARGQQGQALTEFLVVSLALIPLFLLMPMIAKYQDIAHATQMASRYLAFEATLRNDGMSTWKPVDQLAGEVRRRFFSNTDAPIKTGDTAGNFMAHQNLFWRDPKGDALIKDIGNDVKISFGSGNSADHNGAFGGTSDGKPFENLAFNYHNELGLQAKGIYTANITVAVANLPSDENSYTKSYDEFRNIGLTMTRHTSVLIDSWTARDPGQVESRVNKPLLFPGNLLAPVKPLTDLAALVMESPKKWPGFCTSCGPKLGDLHFWSDVVPADRLK